MSNRNQHGIDKRGAFNADKIIDRAVYNALAAVFMDGAYCQKAITDAINSLKDKRSSAFVTSAFYGVLDNNIRLEKIIDGLCENKPGVAPSIVLKIGLYYLRYADMPDYAAVNRAVELSKQLNGVFSGFINAVLKKSRGYEPKFNNGLERFTYEAGAPEWLCRLLITDYGETRAMKILTATLPELTHIRPVNSKITEEQFRKIANGCTFTECGCYCDKTVISKFQQDQVVSQSLSSMRAVKSYAKDVPNGKVIDLCAAPGGKSAYLYELGDYDITACDIYQHKITLINKLAAKSGAKVNAVLNDATVYNKDFDGKFDLVIADCPCSGTGTLKSKPDILLRRKLSDLDELTGLQYKILDVASRYCKQGGVLCYSTCSILKCENEKMRDSFLSAHGEYKLLDETKFLPDTDKCDGFYIVRFKRVSN